MRGFLQLVGVFGVNAIPALGFFAAGWSPATTLAIYWIENLVSTLLVAARIIVHRRLTGKRGHFKADLNVANSALPKHGGTFLQRFFLTAVPFALAHGVFIAVLLFLILPQRSGQRLPMDRDELATAAIATVGFLLVSFVIDLSGIGERPFAWIRKQAEYSLGRAAVVHLTIVVGMFATLFFAADRAFFGIFIALKTLLEVSSRVPQYKPEEPPRILATTLDRLGRRNGESFSEYWRRTRKEEQERAIDDELPAR